MAETKLNADSLAITNDLGVGGAPKSGNSDFRFLELSAATLMAQNNNGNFYAGKNWYFNSGYKYKTANRGFLYVQDDGGHSWHIAPVGVVDTPVPWTQAMTVDTSGNLLVGVTSGDCHHIRKSVPNAGNLILNIDGSTGVPGAAFYFGNNTATPNAANALFKTGTMNVTGRSIATAGTINASGADYAEYMTKAPACGVLAKGQIVGINADGQLVDTWADAVSFLIKSTDPSYVGGDSWGSEAALGMARPVEPVLQLPEYPTTPHPGEPPAGPSAPAPGEDATAEELAAWDEHLANLQAAIEDYEQRAAAYEGAQLAHEQAVAAARQAFDTITMPAYLQDLAEFNDVLEQARQRVDRIAYCGQVPVNVLGAVPGQYVVPVQDGAGIGAKLVNKSAMTLAQYMAAVGVVQNLLPDGRANVRVKVL